MINQHEEGMILSYITIQDLPPEMNYIAENTSFDFAKQLMLLCGGARVNVTLPKTLARAALKNCLLERRRKNIPLTKIDRIKLIRQFGIQENLMNSVIREVYREHSIDNQLNLEI